MIDGYVRDLAGRLPRLRRRRLVLEAEAHLRDAAERHRSDGADADESERLAVRDFGPAHIVAARLAAETGEWAERRVALLVLAAVLLFVVPLYGIPENTLPAAPWTTMPETLAWLRDTTILLWLAAVVLAALGAAARSSLASAAALVAIACSGVLAAILAVRWEVEAPATPLPTLLASTMVLTAAAVVVPAVALVYVRRLRLAVR
jgi:hypothetical protein